MSVQTVPYRPDFIGWPACHPSQNPQWYGRTVPPLRRTMSRAAARASQRDVNPTFPRHERCSNQVAARFDIADATTTPSTIFAFPSSEVPVDLLLREQSARSASAPVSRVVRMRTAMRMSARGAHIVTSWTHAW